MSEPLSGLRGCTKCKLQLPATTDHFSPRKDGKSKLHSWCKSCLAAHVRERRATDPEQRKRHIDSVKRYFKKRMQTDLEYRACRIEKLRDWASEMQRDPEFRAKRLEQARSWSKANWERVRRYKHKCGPLAVAHAARRNAAKLRATPAWSQADRIADLYTEARRLTDVTGVLHNVDHIYPLRGKTVCGLHVIENLQILTEFENKSKSNRHPDNFEAGIHGGQSPQSAVSAPAFN